MRLTLVVENALDEHDAKRPTWKRSMLYRRPNDCLRLRQDVALGAQTMLRKKPTYEAPIF